jgi:hypothetical protein
MAVVHYTVQVRAEFCDAIVDLLEQVVDGEILGKMRWQLRFAGGGETIAPNYRREVSEPM